MTRSTWSFSRPTTSRAGQENHILVGGMPGMKGTLRSAGVFLGREEDMEKVRETPCKVALPS